MLQLVEIRYDKQGKSFLAFQGQSDGAAKEMNRKYIEQRDQIAAKIFRKAFISLNEQKINLKD